MALVGPSYYWDVWGIDLVPYLEVFLELVESIEQDDLSLIRAFQMGEKEAMAQLLRRRQKWLYNVARKTISNESLIEDGLQEALVQIWKGASTFRGDSQVTTWMHQVVVRSCIDVLRKEKIRSHSSLPENAEQLIPSTVRFEDQLVDTMLVHGALLEL